MTVSILRARRAGVGRQTARIEIISPGTLRKNLTVESIRAGNSNLRNPILASFWRRVYCRKTWPDIDSAMT